MQANRRWRDWTPSQKLAISASEEPTKPTKIISVSSVSSYCERLPKIAAPSGMPPHDPAEWREPFARWVNSDCASHWRVFGGVGPMHNHLCDWAIAQDDVPCTRETFEALLQELGFPISDGLVAGLILRRDYEAVGLGKGKFRLE